MRLTPRAEQIEPADAQGDEEDPQQIAESRPAVCRRDRDERDADPDEDEGEADEAVPVGPHAARGPAATMTRLGACLRTKSTVSLNTARRPETRGVPMTMISL